MFPSKLDSLGGVVGVESTFLSKILEAAKSDLLGTFNVGSFLYEIIGTFLPKPF